MITSARINLPVAESWNEKLFDCIEFIDFVKFRWSVEIMVQICIQLPRQLSDDVDWMGLVQFSLVSAGYEQ